MVLNTHVIMPHAPTGVDHFTLVVPRFPWRTPQPRVILKTVHLFSDTPPKLRKPLR